MAKHAKGPNSGQDRKTKGRTAITASSKQPRSSDPGLERRLKVEANRPVKPGTLHRGDRRDTSKTYSGTQTHKSRGSNPRPDVKTRKR